MALGLGSRRDARERALELLYEAGAKDLAPSAVLADLPVTPDAYAVALVRGVEANLVAIDRLIEAAAIDWTLDRMPVVDRTLLRMATYELTGRPDVPTSVVISEAVELAKRYSTDESSRFVNGVLAAVSRATRAEASAGASAGARAEASAGARAEASPEAEASAEASPEAEASAEDSPEARAASPESTG
jgi:N utilization substance protein B